MNERVVVHPDAEAGGSSVAERLGALAQRARRERGRFVLGVSGGESPETLFRALAQGIAGTTGDWWLFWCDERLVPGSDPRSNFGLARRLWLAPVGFPPDHAFPVPTSGPVEASARHYDAQIRAFFGTEGPPGAGPPTFDVLVLGVGPDGHTASLFPGAPSLRVKDRWAVAEPAPARPPLVPRVTLTLAAIGDARTVLFLAWGSTKRRVLEGILSDPGRGGPLGEAPAALVRPRGSIEWHVDRAAWPGREGSGR